MNFDPIFEKIVGYIPNLIGAIVLLIIGFIIAIIVEKTLRKGLIFLRIHEVTSNRISKIVKYVIIIYTIFMALEILDVAKVIVTSTFQIILGSVGLGFAIAFGISFGLAGKEFAENILKDWFYQKKKK
jgi:hypothetical protein